MTPPRIFSALPPQDLVKASPKAISRRTSYLRVRLEFLPYPPLIATLFNGCAFGPPGPFTARPLKARFPSGSGCPHPFPCRVPQLAGPFYKKYAVAPASVVLPPVVNTGFQVLFHSPPGVLFTFPSRYCPLSVTGSYLALGGGPPDFPQGFPCLVVLWILPEPFRFPLRGFHPLRPAFPKPFRFASDSLCSP